MPCPLLGKNVHRVLGMSPTKMLNAAFFHFGKEADISTLIPEQETKEGTIASIFSKGLLRSGQYSDDESSISE